MVCMTSIRAKRLAVCWWYSPPMWRLRLQKGATVNRMMKAGRAVSVLAAVCAATLALGQGTAFAAEEWTVGPSGNTVTPGGKVSITPNATCTQGPCSYGTDWHLRLQTLNGGSIASGQSSTFALTKHSNGARVGNCAINSSTEMTCDVSASGSAETSDYLAGGPLTVLMPNQSCTEAVEIAWFNGSESSVAVISTSGRNCGS